MLQVALVHIQAKVLVGKIKYMRQKTCSSQEGATHSNDDGQDSMLNLMISLHDTFRCVDFVRCYCIYTYRRDSMVSGMCGPFLERQWEVFCLICIFGLILKCAY